MTFSLNNVQVGPKAEPPRIIVYGAHGTGKSTFAANAPNPIFIQTEDGADNLDVARFPLATSFSDVVGQMQVLAEEDHDYQTLVIDSLDWLEPLMWAYLIEQRPTDEKGRPVKDITDYGFGKGYDHAIDYWYQFFAGIDHLRSAKGMMIIMTAHAEIKRFDDPESDPYDRYQIKLHKRASDKVQEKVDAVLFANYAKTTKTTEVGFNNERTRAIGSGQRYLYTSERPAFQAKNRYSLPDQIEMSKGNSGWPTLVEHIPYLKSKYGNKGE